MNGPADDSGRTGDERQADPLLQAVGVRIRDLRTAAGLTPAAVAEAAGITKAFLWRMEAGRQNMSVRSLSRIALALDTTMSKVLEGIVADPDTLGVRGFNWKAGKDTRVRRGTADVAEEK